MVVTETIEPCEYREPRIFRRKLKQLMGTDTFNPQYLFYQTKRGKGIQSHRKGKTAKGNMRSVHWSGYIWKKVNKRRGEAASIYTTINIK